MADPNTSAADMIAQLEAARMIALGDPQYYAQVLPGILPIVAAAAHVEVRRWGADFVAESFANPALATSQKEQLTSDVLPTLRTMLESPAEDVAVVKSAIQASASIYPLLFRRIISHPDQALLWHDMTTIKMNILKRMDHAPSAVKICCAKFIQKVVQVQTPGVIADPRRPDQNETSIALVPRNHPLLPLASMEAEASGLLDRLLSVFQENSGDPITVDATTNCLAVLVRTRPAVSNKIISAVLNYNPLKQANSPMTPRLRVILKSLERTIRALLRYVLRISPNSPMEPKIQNYLMRLQQSRAPLFSDSTGLKRPAEPTDGLDDAKRQRLTGGPRRFPPMGPPPHTYANLFTLTEDKILQQFDVKLLPLDMVNAITIIMLQRVDNAALEEATNAVRARYAHLQKVSLPTPVPDVPLAGPTGIDDEDDYDPEYIPPSDTQMTAATEKVVEELAQPTLDLGPYELPKPAPLSESEVGILRDQTIHHIMEVVASLDTSDQSVPTRRKVGFNRLAASTYDRDAWITILTRLATRAPANLSTWPPSSPTENSSSIEAPTLASRIRQLLFDYIISSFRPRLNLAISWLTEEWYADKLSLSDLKTYDSSSPEYPNYTREATHLLSSILPILDTKDSKLLIRFLSEIPHISRDILQQVKSLARDPERVGMCILALQYLLMLRPPCRGVVLDVVGEIWREGDDQARKAAEKVLKKWKPEALAEGKGDPGVKGEHYQDANGSGAGGGIKVNGTTEQDAKMEYGGDERKSVGSEMPERFDPRKKIVGGSVSPEAVIPTEEIS